MQEAPTRRKQVSLMFAEATGSFLVLLEISREQALFEKLGIDVRTVPASGATVPRLSDEVPLGSSELRRPSCRLPRVLICG